MVCENCRNTHEVSVPFLRPYFVRASANCRKVCRFCALTSCGLPQFFRKPFSVWYIITKQKDTSDILIKIPSLFDFVRLNFSRLLSKAEIFCENYHQQKIFFKKNAPFRGSVNTSFEFVVK
jgi:hypothetical protein